MSVENPVANTLLSLQNFQWLQSMLNLRELESKTLPACFSEVELVAHRQNTINTIRDISTKGWGFECDVRISVDGEAFVYHDSRIPAPQYRTKREHIENLSIGQIRKLELYEGNGRERIPTGQRIPELNSVLQSFPGTPMLIDLKSRGSRAERILVQSLRNFPDCFSHVAVIARSLEAACRLSGLLPPLSVCWSVEGLGRKFFNRLMALGQDSFSGLSRIFQAVSFPASLITATLKRSHIEFLEACGFGIFGYGVNSYQRFICCQKSRVIPVSDYLLA